MNDHIRQPDGSGPPGRRSNLGRGLSALFGEATADYASLDKNSPGKPRQDKPIPIEFLGPGRFQPRRHFDDDSLGELIQSVKEKGILQPLLVRRNPDDNTRYEIIAGERRWRAAQAAGLHDVPVLVRDFTDREALEVSLIENIQRQDLNPLEEAEGYRRLMEEFEHTQEELAKALGKSRSHIANTVRLLALPDSVRGMLETGLLTAGHARALLTSPDAQALAEQVVRNGLTVRETEQLARGDLPAEAGASVEARPARSGAEKDADTLALERELSSRLGLKVALTAKGKGGTVTIHYRSLDQFDDLLRRLEG